MLSSLFGSGKGRPRKDRSPFSSPRSGIQQSPVANRRSSQEQRRRIAGGFEHNGSNAEDDIIIEEDGEEDDAETDQHIDEDGEDDQSPLLPIFSAAHLDALPVYNLTHTIRLLVVSRCETTLSWDQLRSPQVSQFLLKPIQQDIRTSHFSRATLYALMANCLQFSKEMHLNPGNSGTSKTRALVCELIAIKLLKEYSLRELIDALSYDFFPLQGAITASAGNVTPGPNWDHSQRPQSQSSVARISTLEIAIRAQAKRFLAHPLVVQQIEAIWAGTVVFHSAADNLHRPAVKVVPNQNRGYGATAANGRVLKATDDTLQPAKQRDHREPIIFSIRRSVTIYDPRDASLFKLSRLRVPRYRQTLSTCSFAVLLGLFLAVLIERSLTITALEVVFWFWSAGFMLDEIVGFNEQGFSLYIMSFWNTFDLGILLLFVAYYCMRLYGVLMPQARKHHVANMAYDILAANAVFLFPRLFSILDHYRYFSQLLIAFRMMALDLIAVFILIVISCSGFFVAFTLSFGDENDDAGAVAYALFQIILGFTPAAWSRWDGYNALGKSILTLFLFICHFLIVTILITVLTNSFVSVVQNANEEHQFVFAVNAISMVKSDSLFSYIAPTNVIAWLLAPLRYAMTFRNFVRLNRIIIKITHFPVLSAIYIYERVVLQSAAFESTELIEQRGRSQDQLKGFGAPKAAMNLFSPRVNRLREPSVATFHKDRALEAVFRQPYKGNTLRSTQKSHQRRETSNVVNRWMRSMGPDGTASPPVEQDHSVVDQLEQGVIARKKLQRGQTGRKLDVNDATRSVLSDPEDSRATGRSERSKILRNGSDLITLSMDDLPEQTDADGDDELVTNDEDDKMTVDQSTIPTSGRQQEDFNNVNEQDDYFQNTPIANARTPLLSTSVTSSHARFADPHRQAPLVRNGTPIRKAHLRNASTNTILHRPIKSTESSSSYSRMVITAKNSVKNTASGSGVLTPSSPNKRTPRRLAPTRPRSIMPPRTTFKSTPNLTGLIAFGDRQAEHKRPSLLHDLGSDLGDNKAIGGGYIGPVPSSFQTQMAYASGAMRARRAAASGSEDQSMMSRLMLARMNTLEQGFRDILKEVKDWRSEENKILGEEWPGSKGARARKANRKEKLKGEAVESGSADERRMREIGVSMGGEGARFEEARLF